MIRETVSFVKRYFPNLRGKIMFTKFKNRLLIILSAVLASLLIMAGAFMFTPKTTAYADTANFKVTDGEDNTTYYGTIEAAFTAANTAGTATIKMYADAEISSTLVVEAGKDLTLDLNGCMLKMSEDGNDSVITVNGTFTLEDNGGGSSSHTIISPVTNEEVTIYGGLITGGNTAGNGGGVYVDSFANFTLTDGTISGNTSSFSGGGVFAKGGAIFKMTGGTISGNTSTDWGGGVRVTHSTFTMTGGTISGNATNCIYGGVIVEMSVFNVSGAVNITGNTNGDADEANVDLYWSNITIIDALEKDGVKAQIGIRPIKDTDEIATKIATGFTQESPSEYFIIDDNSYNRNKGFNCIFADEDGIVYFGTHTGGTASCTEKAECETCGNEYGDFGEHDWNTDDWVSDGETHWHACQNEGCTETDTKVEHSGTDDGDCTTRLFCAICGYGIKAAQTEHLYDVGYTKNENQHWHVCIRSDCTQTDTKVNHSGTDDGDCTTQLFCAICGYGIKAAEAEHNYSETWTTNENQHWHECLNEDCTQTDTKADHEYTLNIATETYLESAATCTAKAVYYKSCVCGMHGTETFEYGEPVSHVSAEAVRENEVAATCTQAGSYDEVVYCSVCNEELGRTEKSLAVDETAHAWGEWTVTKEATETEEGEERRVCANDGTHVETRPLPKLVAPDNNDGLSAGAIAGIVIACILIALLILYVACYFALYRRDILLKGKFFDAIYVPMNAIFVKKEQEEGNS